MAKAENTVRLVACVACKRLTRHEVLFTQTVSDTDEEHGIEFGEGNHVVRCLGCLGVSFISETWNDTRVDLETHEPIVAETLYPSRTEGRRLAVPPHTLPGAVSDVLKETLVAFNAGARLLTAVGLRAVVESLCLDQKCAGKNLKEKLEDLASKGSIATAQATFLDLHRLIGNEAVHEMIAPSSEELAAALDIVESVLKTTYELPGIAGELKARRDKRMAAAKKV
jgi:hypothetical protein